METRKIRIKVNTYGRAPDKYGPNVYKAGLADSLLFERAGWVCVGSGKHYRYVRSPEGRVGREVEIEIEVPTDAEIELMAMTMHATRENQAGGALGFLAWYKPAGGIVSTLSFPGTDEPDQVQRRSHAEFEFGMTASWGINLTWDRGDEAPPTWHRSGEPGTDG